jgi:hypothetical protein
LRDDELLKSVGSDSDATDRRKAARFGVIKGDVHRLLIILPHGYIVCITVAFAITHIPSILHKKRTGPFLVEISVAFRVLQKHWLSLLIRTVSLERRPHIMGFGGGRQELIEVVVVGGREQL